MVGNLPGTILKTNPDSGFKSLYASRNYNKGEILTSFSSFTLHATPSRYTIQIGEKRHIELQPTMLRFINHSCQPNLFFDIPSRQVICLEQIIEGQAFSYFYPSTEWEMSEPFDCHCGSENCLKIIKGAAYLSKDVVNKYGFTDFILKKLHLLHG